MALQLAEQIDDRQLVGRSLYALGYRFSLDGHYAQAQIYLEQARDHFMVLDDQTELAKTLRALGDTHQFQGYHDTGLAIYEQALQLATAQQDREWMGWSMMSIGHVHYVYTAWQTAFEWYERGLATATEIHHLPMMQASYCNMANALNGLNRYRDALACYQRSLAGAQQLGYTPAITLTLGNMGHTYGHLGQYTDALACLCSSIMIGRAVSTSTLGWHLPQIGVYYMKLGRDDDAKRLLDRGIAICRALNNETPLTQYLYERAVLMLKHHDLHSAQRDAIEARELADRMGYKGYQLSCRLLESRIAVGLGQRSQAAAISEIEQLRADWPDEFYQAEIAYAIWEIDPSRELERQEAAARYLALYQQSEGFSYRECYEQLTGERLPEATPLPPPPSIATHGLVSADILLAHANAVVSSSI